SWDVEEIAKALKIRPEDVKEYFTDGRRVSFIVERRIAREVLKGTLAPTEGAGYDVIDSKGGKWEVRSITKRGIYFCPSYMVGSGRHFEEKGFLRKLDELEGFIIADVVSFPDIPFWIVSVEQIKDWWKRGELGKNTIISRKKALKLLKETYTK
ncbi:MAG: hypothetical protein GXO48_06050, partial [Chlorobi bacterium]|nr:hypothetical protein [Chlorobiota bacterium]